MKCSFVQTHPLGGQSWTKIYLSVSEYLGIRSKERGSISREVNLVLHNHIFFSFVSFIKGESEKDFFHI